MDIQEDIVQVPYRGSSLVGILTKPEIVGHENKGIIFLNGGLKAKYGPGRLYVRLAKALSQKGYFIFRFDAPGLGDSLSNTIKTDRQTHLFNQLERGLFVDSGKKMASYFKKNYNLKKLAAFGLCGGGINSCMLAASDEIVDGAIALNPSPTYSGFWGKSLQLAVKEYLRGEGHRLEMDGTDTGMEGEGAAALRVGNLSKEIYINIFPDKNILRFSKLKLFIYFISIIQNVPYGMNGYFVSSVRRLKKRGKKVFLCYSEKDYNYNEYCALLKYRLQDLLSLEECVIPEANHIVDEEQHQKQLVSYLCKAMEIL